MTHFTFLEKDIQNAQILINDIQGRVIYESGLNLLNNVNHQINLSKEAIDGLFFITIYNENNILKSERFVFIE